LLILVGAVLLLQTLGVFPSLGAVVWALVLAGLGLLFWLVYLSNRDQWWALILGCVLAAVGLGILARGSLTAIIVTAGVSLPFWLIYRADRQNRWALIPGWVTACVTAILVLGEIGLESLVAPLVMFAVALPFLLIYTLDRAQWWALIPGGIMAAIGVLLLGGMALGSGTCWSVLLIVLGLWFIYRQFRPARPAPPPAEEPAAFPGGDELAAPADEPR
jgi:hypothetical protein